MGDITSSKNLVRDLKRSINVSVEQTFNREKAVILDYQTEEQLNKKGEDSKGKKIEPAYKRITIKIKKSKGQPTNRVTLKDTGKWQNSIRVIAKSNHVEITTNHVLTEKLLTKYGDNVLGIQEELLSKFTKQYIVPNLKKTFHDKITKS